MARRNKNENKEVTVMDGVVVRYNPNDLNNDKINIAIRLLDKFIIYARIVKYSKGEFISYPNYKGKNGEYHDLSYCLDKDINEKILDAVLDGDNDLPFK